MHIPPRASQNPCPWHLPGDQLSLHLCPTPSAALSTKNKVLPFPATVAKPRGCERLPSTAEQLAETRCCEGGSAGKAREDRELPLTFEPLCPLP